MLVSILGAALLCSVPGAYSSFSDGLPPPPLQQEPVLEFSNFFHPEDDDGEFAEKEERFIFGIAKPRLIFTLYTNPSDTGASISYNDTSIGSSTFNSALDTKILIHGWTPDGSTNGWWITKMIKSLFTKGAMNIIVVNWLGLNNKDYYVSAGKSVEVGHELALLLQALKKRKALNPSKVHIIGFDIGAHIAGICGSQFQTIGRITGLDPAGFYFQDTNVTVRLDADDAAFVDVVHTDSDSFGYRGSIGDVDIYFNGGSAQPGAEAASPFIGAFIYFGAAGAIGASHYRAVTYFQESLDSSTVYRVYRGNGYTGFLLAEYFHNSFNFGLTMSTTARGDMYALTTNHAPYLSTNYVKVLVNTASSRIKGTLNIEHHHGNHMSQRTDVIPNGGIFNVFGGDLVTTLMLHTGYDISSYSFTLTYSSLFSNSFSVNKATISYVAQNRPGSFSTCSAFDVMICSNCTYTLALKC